LGYREARGEFATCRNVSVLKAPVDDIWMRDIAPTFGWRGDGTAQEVVGIDWNFNGWGNTRERCIRPGDRLANKAPSIFGVPRVTVPFVAEGGALVTNGCGTLAARRGGLTAAVKR
jgi:agmatine deiminase